MSAPIPTEIAKGPERRMSGAIILGVPALLVAITFLFWYQTWFGRQLSAAELREYLVDTSVPHHTQHALTQVAAEIVRGDPTVHSVYPQVAALAGSKEAGLRSMAAWVMGQDNTSPEFHAALLKLVRDSDPTVQWNAALALARFGDAAGEPPLKFMLRPFELRTPSAGRVNFRISLSDAVRSGSIVARIKTDGSSVADVRSPLSGVVQRLAATEGAPVAAGDVIAVISPDEQQVWEALRALDLVGRVEDLDEVEHFTKPGSSMSDRVRQQALLTAEAIRTRALILGTKGN
jgi:hypothetical protein